MSFNRTLVFCFLSLVFSACDPSPLGKTQIYGDKVISRGLDITQPVSMALPSSYVLAGDFMETIDVNNLFSGDDENQTYQCYFDREINQTVDSVRACTDLPGVSDFDVLTGVLNWQTSQEAPGPYEFKIIAKDYLNREVTKFFTISVRPAYEINSSLIKDHSRFFSSVRGPKKNSDSDNNSWLDLENMESMASLNSFAYSASSGWDATDFSLIYNGVDNFSQHGVLATHSQFTLDFWIKPLNSSAPNATIVGNYDEANRRGFEISQAADGSGRLELKINILTYSAAVQNSSPVSYYKLDETSGITALDSGSAGHDGVYNSVTLADPETPISSEASVSALFNGSSSFVDLGNAPEHQMTGNQTIEFWIRPTAFSTRRNPFAKAYGGEGTMTLETNGRLNYYYGTSGANTTPYQGFGSGTLLTLNSWHHVALVRDLANSRLYWYINGVQTSTTSANFASATAGANSTYIGQGYVNRIAGQMAHVALYDRALSAAEVLLHFESSAASKCESTTSFSNGSWYHVAALFDGSQHKLFVNNSEECSVSRSYTESSLPLLMGGRASSNYWMGHLGGFRFYNIADPNIINTNFNSTQALY